MNTRMLPNIRETLQRHAGWFTVRQPTWNDPSSGILGAYAAGAEATPKARALLVEDDEKLAKSVKTGVEIEGYAVTRSGTAEEAFRLITQNCFDIVLLDVGLPDKSGLELLLAMRNENIKTPVIVLTARDTISDRVLGLESGADDYLVKPFAFPELLARIRALLRRGRTAPMGEHLRCADLEIDTATRKVTRLGVSVTLTFREFEILEYLCRNQGHIVSRETLARDVWKETSRCTPLDNVINVHIARLRRKVDDGFSCKLLHTARRLGFIMQEGAP